MGQKCHTSAVQADHELRLTTPQVRTESACGFQHLSAWRSLTDMGTCRQAVPLAIALLFVSNPDVQALDALSRLSHDANLDVAQNAVLAMGTYSAGGLDMTLGTLASTD